MGTPWFAVPSLTALVERGLELAAVVTQPDRPVGRHGSPQPSSVKQAAERLGLPVLQPRTLRAPDAVAALRAVAPDVIVVVAFGQILRPAVLGLPPLGCVNVHASLLPELRGAAPIQAAIREGLDRTGVTVMLMNERMDEGPILAQVSAPIFPDDTAATLGDRLARLGADLLVDTLPRWQAGEIAPRAQSAAAATYSRPLRKEDAEIDWSQPAEQIARTCRAYTPWPGCQTTWEGRQLRLLAVTPRPDWTGPAAPGTVVLLPSTDGGPAELAVATGRGALRLDQVQMAGKRPLLAAEFQRGQPRFVGARLGPG
jgi:methionyl-tRNA formyltransferase